MGLRVKINDSTWINPKYSFINNGSGMKSATKIYSKVSESEWKLIWERYKETVKYIGKGTALSNAVLCCAVANVGDYVLFAGGKNTATSTKYSAVDTYNSSLTKGTATSLSESVEYIANYGGGTIGNYALFAGGSGANGYLNTVFAFNASLTKSTATALSTARNNNPSINVGDYVLFAGGYNGSRLSVVDAYNKSLSKSTPTDLSFAANYHAGGTIGDYALIAGGSYGSSKFGSVANAYDKSLTRTLPTELSVARGYLRAVNAGDYLLFVGGYNGSSRLADVDAYDKSLTRTTISSLPSGRNCMGVASVGEFGVIAGGIDTSLNLVNNVVVYDASLTRTELSLSEAKCWPCGGSIGKHILFAGGELANDTATNVVEVFQLS